MTNLYPPFTANADYLGLKAAAQALWRTAEEEKQRIPDRLAEAFQDQLQNIRPADEVVQALEALRAELAMSDGISPAVVRRYEELKEVVSLLVSCTSSAASLLMYSLGRGIENDS